MKLCVSAGALMGCVAAAVATYFMTVHKGLKYLFQKLGLDVGHLLLMKDAGCSDVICELHVNVGIELFSS